MPAAWQVSAHNKASGQHMHSPLILVSGTVVLPALTTWSQDKHPKQVCSTSLPQTRCTLELPHKHQVNITNLAAVSAAVPCAMWHSQSLPVSDAMWHSQPGDSHTTGQTFLLPIHRKLYTNPETASLKHCMGTLQVRRPWPPRGTGGNPALDSLGKAG